MPTSPTPGGLRGEQGRLAVEMVYFISVFEGDNSAQDSEGGEQDK